LPKQSPSTLADDLAVPPPHPNRRAVCALIEQAQQLPERDGAAVLAAVENPKWSTRQLSTVLGKHGIKINFTAIGNHRRGVCPCYRKDEA
jgi:hypothetical protein